ncbi:hypothetical protein [Fischerella sp. PCC 9605]|uniref:hypothetical protein n=1 Tax=Fischerella sp. PCC 9605 TaxID=1173024 RepID=UPI00047C1B77
MKIFEGIGDWAKISQKLKAKSKKKEFFLLPFYFLLFTFPVSLPLAPVPSPLFMPFEGCNFVKEINYSL